jgi:ABC-type long-subunit fatty acid transport system fused permease/ATPase subunit
MVQRYTPLQRTHSKSILCSSFIRLDVHFFQTPYTEMLFKANHVTDRQMHVYSEVGKMYKIFKLQTLLTYALFYTAYIFVWRPLMVAQWLRYCATNRKVAGSVQDGVIGILH